MSRNLSDEVYDILTLIDDEGDDEQLGKCAWIYLYLLWLKHELIPVDTTVQRELALLPKNCLREAEVQLLDLHAIAIGDGGFVITALGVRAHLASLADYGVTLD